MWILNRKKFVPVVLVFLQISFALAYNCPDSSVIIDDENVCDFRIDCPDGADESTCPSSCDFEDGLCEWNHETDTSVAELEWTMWSNDAPSYYAGPPVDHTTNANYGHYLYVDDTYTNKDQLAIIRSPTYQQAARGCTFSFWYFVYGVDFGTLKVWQYTPSDQREYNLMTAEDRSEDMATTDRWNFYQVEVQACAQDFRLSIEAKDTFNYENTGGYAIDDLVFEGCAYDLPLPIGGACQTTEGTCDSGHCYPGSEDCDYTLNCCDGTDEAPAHCIGYRMCSFEEGMCDWEQLTDDDQDWTRQKSGTGTDNTGPWKDHTTRSNNGYYVYTEVNNAFPGDTYRLGSFYILPTSSGCQMRFYSHMFGSGIGTLNVYTRTQINGPLTKIWSKLGAHGNYWLYSAITLTSLDAFQVIFEGVRGDNNVGDIALDDITFTPDCTQSPQPLPIAGPSATDFSCPSGMRPCNLDECIDEAKYCDFKQDCLPTGEDEMFCPDTCTFDDNLCYWSQDVDDDIDWTWFDVSSVSPTYQGPVSDHSTGTSNGRYLFVDATTSRQGNYARILSPVYKFAPRGCTFNMWFYMFGVEYGDLEVKLIDENGNSHITKVRDNAFDYNKWIQWESEIRSCTANFQIAIESQDKLQVPIESGFAIDDVSFTDCTFPDQVPFGSCVSGMMQCASQECYPAGQHCDMNLDCCDRTDESECDAQGYSQCDFEDGLCDWEQLTSDEFDWTWQQGGTPDNWRRTGPQVDHTLGTADGWYIFTEASDRRRNGDRAIIVSYPIQATTSGQCAIRIHYHMEGQGIGTLNVYTRTAINGPKTQLWSRDRSLGEQWNYENLQLIVSSDFQVVIEGVIGYTAESDIGLDDISLTPQCNRVSSLPEFTTPQIVEPTRRSCLFNQYLCFADNICISSVLVCDGYPDCSDGQDEGMCSVAPPGKNTSLIIGLSVTFGLLFLVAAGAAIFFILKRHEKKKFDPSLVTSAQAQGVSNPTYVHKSESLQMS